MRLSESRIVLPSRTRAAAGVVLQLVKKSFDRVTGHEDGTASRIPAKESQLHVGGTAGALPKAITLMRGECVNVLMILDANGPVATTSTWSDGTKYQIVVGVLCPLYTGMPFTRIGRSWR